MPVQDLIYSTNYVESSLPIKEVKQWLRTQPSVHTLGVIGDDVFGLITRARLNQATINAAADPDFPEQPVGSIMILDPLIVEASTPADEVVALLLTRKGQAEDQFSDIIVTDRGQFAGLLAPRDLLFDQVENLTHRLAAAETQQAALVKKNRELFEASFRQGQTEMQFKTVFERAPVPLALFDSEGRLVAGNQRFLTLAGLTPLQIDRNTAFHHFFNEPYAPLWRIYNDAWASGGPEQPTRSLPMNGEEGATFPVEGAFEFLPDDRQLLLAIIGLGSSAGESVPVEETITPSRAVVRHSARKSGKITQAIKTRLATHGAQGLARSVATNLIDKEKHLDRMMKKLEAIIAITDQLEQREKEPTPAPGTSGDSTRRLAGDLSEFSVIDLCQILIQGTKTGRLKVFARGSEEIQGNLYFYCGSLVHADTPCGAKGTSALEKIVALRQGAFDFEFDASAPESSLKGDAMGLLMDACRAVDEATPPV
ncbi:MAG: hypothetical protein OHK005_08930 [Candidatus Methylacidiphilales bacterium]